MKKLTIFFLSFTLVFLPVPILGIYSQHKIFDLSIFNYSYSLYNLGVSSNKGNVVLGDNGWMFLGNNFNSVFNKSKSTYTTPTKLLADNDKFIKQLKVISKENNANFKFIVFPNKYSVYGENIGLDTKVNSYSYFQNKNLSNSNMNMISYFRNIKNKSNNDLYFKTDTHWNDLGSFYGYQFIMSNILNGKYKKLSDTIKFNKVAREGGDLARFINLQNIIVDQNVSVEDDFIEKVIRTNLVTNEITDENIQGNINNSEIKVPIKVVNKSALNNLNVLWLHDSFGQAMSPFMHLTFSEITHQHYFYALQDKLAFKKLIQDVKPDLIILSAVERDHLTFNNYLGWNGSD